MISTNPTYFGTGVPSSGSLRTRMMTSLKLRLMKLAVGLVILCVHRLPENGTLVPTHVGFGTYHELCCMICVFFYFIK